MSTAWYREVHQLAFRVVQLEHIEERAKALAGELEFAREENAELREELRVRGEAFNGAIRRWLQTVTERDHARDLAARLAANQPVREAPDSLMEAVLGADTGCWFEGPGAAA